MARRRTQEEFIEQSLKKHGEKYDYNKSDYINEYTKIIIICREHGEFEQKPSIHLKGHGCRKCRYEKLAANMGGGLTGFIKKASKIHDNKYDYSKVEYSTSQKKVVIICPEHGEFEQLPCNHINKCAGCLKCSTAYQPTNKEFINKLVYKFGERHDYSKTIYTSSKDRITVICPEHGEFQIRAESYVRSGSCPRCCSSNEQLVIHDFVTSFEPTAKSNDREAIRPLELDVYIPSKKLGIEYNGNYWHSFNRNETTEERKRHQTKFEKCEKSGIRLFQINTTEYEDKFEIVQSMIRHRLGLSKKVGARKTMVKEISNKEAGIFLDRCHISGHRNASKNYGLILDDKLIATTTFSKYKIGWEIIRYANELNITVVGGFSRLLKSFIIDNRPKTIMTFADLRYGSGNVYKESGFELVKRTKPGYVYLDSNARYMGSRIKFQKHKLEKILEVFHTELTESENMFLNGYRRMWDAGHNQFILNL